MNLTSRIRLFCASARSVAPFVSPTKGCAAQGNGDGDGAGNGKKRWRKIEIAHEARNKSESLAANLGIICYPQDKSVQKTRQQATATKQATTAAATRKNTNEHAGPLSLHYNYVEYTFSIFVDSGDAI